MKWREKMTTFFIIAIAVIAIGATVGASKDWARHEKAKEEYPNHSPDLGMTLIASALWVVEIINAVQLMGA